MHKKKNLESLRTDYVRDSPIIRTCVLYNRLECNIDIFDDFFAHLVNSLQSPRP